MPGKLFADDDEDDVDDDVDDDDDVGAADNGRLTIVVVVVGLTPISDALLLVAMDEEGGAVDADGDDNDGGGAMARVDRQGIFVSTGMMIFRGMFSERRTAVLLGPPPPVDDPAALGCSSARWDRLREPMLAELLLRATDFVGLLVGSLLVTMTNDSPPASRMTTFPSSATSGPPELLLLLKCDV